MFKRPRLRATSRLVNASFALALLFVSSGCGQSPSSPPQAAETAPEASPSVPVEEGLILPAVWNTSELEGPVASLGIAGMLGSTIAVGFEDGGLQLFNFDGDRVTDKADLGVQEIGDGRYMLLAGAPVTLFPGIDQNGGLFAYIHGGDLPEPLPLDLKTREIGDAAGLCSAPPSVDSDGVMRLAFWTKIEPRKLMSGRLVEVGEELVYLLDDPVMADKPISACVLEETGATVFSAPAQDVVVLERNGRRHTLTLDTSGNYARLRSGEPPETLTIRDGMSVKAPEVPSAMTGTGDARGGGYTGGLVVIAGEVASGDHRAVLIDPSKITLLPLEVPKTGLPN
ncbi:MAG: hypothetical protein AAF613_02285 [Pseudomonadota bacterium]